MKSVGRGVDGRDGEVEAYAPIAEYGEEGEGLVDVVRREAVAVGELPTDYEEGYCECVEGLGWLASAPEGGKIWDCEKGRTIAARMPKRTHGGRSQEVSKR